jgi:hypothetical protein
MPRFQPRGSVDQAITGRSAPEEKATTGSDAIRIGGSALIPSDGRQVTLGGELAVTWSSLGKARQAVERRPPVQVGHPAGVVTPVPR